MSFSAFVALSPLFLENYDLLVLLVFKNLGGHGSAFDGGRTKRRFAVVDNHEYLVDLYLITFVCLGEAVHEQFVALFYRELTALGLNCGFHDRKIFKKTIFRPIWQASSWLLACYSSLELSSR